MSEAIESKPTPQIPYLRFRFERGEQIATNRIGRVAQAVIACALAYATLVVPVAEYVQQ